MALVVNDRVQQTGSANTTVSFTLTGTVTGFQSFSVVGNGNTTYYAATDSSGNWEVGIGTYSTTGPTLTRTTILSSSNSGSAVTFSGTVTVFVTYPSEKSINYDANDVATIGSVLNYSDTGIIGSFASTVAGYNQVIIQNKSSATNASSNLNVSNNVSTATTGFAELGINSSTFTGTGSFNIAGAAYLASASTDLAIGTYGAYNVHFVTNSNTTDAMTIYNSGGVSLGGYADPGIGTLYANNVYLGFNPITAAAGTTVLTNASAAYQNVVGTTTQTIQLPNATTLYKGLAFTIANASTGTVTIKNNASTTIDTIVTGGTSVLVLTDNSTSAGTWSAYSYLPASYDFSTTTANFGTATITNATWNGGTIATGYGGTGLTTFSAANNAIYSTSSSALTAGTLPVLAGGTGVTTSTGSGSNVLNTSPTLVTPVLGAATGTSLSLSLSALTSSNTSNFQLGSTLSFSDTGITNNIVGNTNSYLQSALQNTNAGAAASAEYIVYNNNGTASTNFATFGINSSAYTGTGSINAAGYGYFLTGSTDIVIGTIGANNVHITTNSQATDAITVNTSNSVAFNGSYGTSGQVLTSAGSGAAPTWQAVSVSVGPITQNLTTVSSNQTIPSGQNGFSVGPMTINSGITVTVTSGQRWVVI